MTVDTYWRRSSFEAVQGLEPAELRALVPMYYDEPFAAEAVSRTTVMGEDTGTLIGAVLRFSTDNDADDYAAWLAVSGADGLEDDAMIGVLEPEQVRVAAEFLARVDPAALMEEFHDDLARGVAILGYQRPFDEAWAAAVVTDLRHLIELFVRAAAAGEAVTVMIVA